MLFRSLTDFIFEVRGDGQVRQYPGNWSDWNAAREPEEPVIKASAPKAAPQRPKSQKLKFSYKEEREFSTIDGDIAALEEQIAQCTEQQNSCGSDYVKLQSLQEKQGELEALLEEKMDRWMSLTELKEKIDAQ